MRPWLGLGGVWVVACAAALSACGDDDKPKKAPDASADAAATVMLDAQVAVPAADAGKPRGSDQLGGLDGGALQCAAPIDHPCLNCAAQRCCGEATRCSNDAECTNLSRCIARCGSKGAVCQQQCVMQASTVGSELLLAYIGCERKECPSVCTSASVDAGL